MTVREHLQAARDLMAGLPAGRLEAEILLAHCLEAPRSLLYANPELEVPVQRSDCYQQMLARRLEGEPIAYLTGIREFWSLPLRVNPDVLIPRAETERLVELALEHLPGEVQLRVADLGTGSGAVALALASERPECEVHGTDASEPAVLIARGNATRLAIENVRFHVGSWCEPLEGQFDMVVSNPPYVAQDDPHLGQGDCRFEPRSALTPGYDPLAAIRSVAAGAMSVLKPGGWLLLEHGPEQGPACRGLLRAAGYERPATERDLLGHERVTLAQCPG
jgi:release factor glutamine methyltransferase